LVPLEDEIGSDELDSILSNIELKNIDAILADMPSPDPDAEQVVDDESTVVEPAAATEGPDKSSWIHLSEAEEEPAQNIDYSLEAANEKFDPEYPRELTDDTTWMTPPALPAEFMEQQVTELEATATIADDPGLEQNTAKPEDSLITDENKEEIIEETPVVSQDLPILDFNLPWESAEQKSEIPEQPAVESEYESPISIPEDQLLTPEESVESEYESPVSAPEDQRLTPEEPIDPKDLEFIAWLDEIIPVSAPFENDGIESIDHADDVLLPLPDEIQAIESPTESVDVDDDISSLFTELEPLTESTEIETELQDGDDEEGSVPLVIPTEYEPEDQVLAQELELIPESDVIEPEVQNQSSEEPAGSIDLPPALPVDIFNTNLASEPGTSPLGIKNFRFHYTCLLIPCNPQQFLTRDLSERLSFLIPQLHLEYGWRLTGITIRPQYMLWSISLPVDACPVHLVRDIRRRTTAHITSNFTDLTPIGDGDDFWAPGFLILSGYTSPTIGMITDFISQTRMNQSLNA
jgi:REP element-mobilizing transposase RayT